MNDFGGVREKCRAEARERRWSARWDAFASRCRRALRLPVYERLSEEIARTDPVLMMGVER